eukprot:757794-Hanusia_phi.AAC.2
MFQGQFSPLHAAGSLQPSSALFPCSLRTAAVSASVHSVQEGVHPRRSCSSQTVQDNQKTFTIIVVNKSSRTQEKTPLHESNPSAAAGQVASRRPW